MPFAIDVYVWLRRREESVLMAFLDEYMPDWQVAELWLDAEPPLPAIQRALNEPHGEPFARYGRTADPGVTLIIAFPVDGSLVLGLSVEAEDEQHGAAAATRLLDRLYEQFGAERGVAVWEEPPLLWADAPEASVDRVCASRP